MHEGMFRQGARAIALLATVAVFALLALGQNGPTVRRDVHHDTSLPLSVMIKNAPPVSSVVHEAEPLRRIPLPPGLNQNGEDPVLQHTTIPGTPSVGLSFEGLGNGQYGFSVTGAPPDTEGAVGATQYVQWVNTSFAIFNKTTGALISGPTAGNTLWSGFGGGCQSNNDGDPIVTYDKIGQRWIFSQFSVSTTPYLQCIAVSTTNDATGTYNRYSFQYSYFDDYPKMGVWADAYYETFNMFNGNTFVGADACAYDRNAMMAGTTATQVCFQQGSSVGGLLPSDIDGTTAPPSGEPNFMIYYGTNNLNLYKFHVDFTTPSNSTFTGPTVISVASFSALCGGGTCVPQPSVSQQLDSLADRLMYRLAYRNFGTHESLVANHSVTAGSSGGVRWYEIQNPNGTPTVAQQSTFAPDSNYRWMGSVAMDHNGDMALGYTISSSSVYPTVAYTGRLSTDPASTMESEVTVASGSGSQNGNLSRWGDYSAMQVDPVDDCTFWYTQEYMKTTGSFNWNTRINTLKFSGCGSSTPDFSLSASPSSLSITQGGNGTSTITVTPINGFTSSVSLSASGLPSGVTASFNPTSTTTTSVLTLTASSTATSGTSTVTITGTSGSLVHTTTISLTVTTTGGGGQVAVYSSTYKAPWCSAVGSSCDSGSTLLLGRDTMSGGAESNQPNTISSACADGTSGTFHSDESNDRLMVATTDGSSFAPGKTVTVTATIWAYSGYTSDHLDLYYAANASSPGWTAIQTNMTPPGAGAQTMSANFTLPSGSVQAVRAVFRYLGSASSCTTGAYDDHDDLVFAVGAGSPSFTLSANPSSVTVVQGNTATSTITVNPQNGFTGTVSLSASGLPSGVTASFNPTSTTSTSTLTFTASSTATLGTSTVTVTGTSGSLVATTNITLTVASTNGGPQTAVYSTTLKAPECATVGSSCDSGPTLLLGRGTMSGGVESNHPNTINSACADGNTGTFHSDESNDRLSVASTNGGNLTHGNTVTVTATVWAYSGYTSDALDLYYAANANSPSWVFIKTIVPPGPGAQTLSTTFTLPTGTLEAVRANFRYLGSAAVCPSGSYNDHDDLIFAVQ
jgi:hypothetical protein